MLREAKVPKPKVVLSVSPVAHRDPRRMDAKFLRGDLRQGRLQPLAVRLDANHQYCAAVSALSLPLPLAYGRHAEQLGAQAHAGRLVTAVVVHVANRGIGNLLRPIHVLCAYLNRVASNRPGNVDADLLLAAHDLSHRRDKPFGKARSSFAPHAAIRSSGRGRLPA
jgi:hypothetical protein